MVQAILMLVRVGFCTVFCNEAMLFVLNYTAPCLIRADVSTCTLKMVGQMITSPMHAAHSCGLLLSPKFSYKPGLLFNEEFTILKQLSNTGCVVDASFQLLFDVKSKSVAWRSYMGWGCKVLREVAFMLKCLGYLRISGTRGLWLTKATS